MRSRMVRPSTKIVMCLRSVITSYSIHYTKLYDTPSTKGILEGIPGVPAVDDVNITRADIDANFSAFNFSSPGDVDLYEKLLREGFDLISARLAELDQIFVDTKFEFGYVTDRAGRVV